jgi:tetratricopeptide (TPR) repeat protein
MRRLIFALVLLAVVTGCSAPLRREDQPSRLSATTSRDDMAATVAAMTTRLAESPTDSDAAVRLADTWLRQARVLNRASLHKQAEEVLNRVIDAHPSDYLARRMRAAVYLAQHRFQDAILEAGRCRALRAQDPVIDGILGDALLELGDLPGAIEAFDRMLAQRPDAASYARASYARELQGDVQGALADEATSAHDVESQAWHAAQLGNLHVSTGNIEEALRHFTRADTLFPAHPFATIGLARLDLLNGRPANALSRLQPRLETAPTADDFQLAGDALLKLGHTDEARRHHALAAALAAEETRVVPPGGAR